MDDLWWTSRRHVDNILIESHLSETSNHTEQTVCILDFTQLGSHDTSPRQCKFMKGGVGKTEECNWMHYILKQNHISFSLKMCLHLWNYCWKKTPNSFYFSYQQIKNPDFFSLYPKKSLHRLQSVCYQFDRQFSQSLGDFWPQDKNAGGIMKFISSIYGETYKHSRKATWKVYMT